ncbi:MAG: formylglycine-generating enzyme family protein [Planctomycetota bacterium]|jgi:formylglycine-generating enzyme required for sulfatase activity
MKNHRLGRLALAFAGWVALSGCAGCGDPAPPPIQTPAGMTMVTPGQFKMGFEGTGATDLEKPAKLVKMPKGFFIDIYEVTNGEYVAFCKAKKRQLPTHLRGKSEADLTAMAKLPVVNVSLGDAKAYAEHTGKRIPSEKEWEYAARGVGSKVFPWGDSFATGHANTFDEGKKQAVAVGSFTKGKGPFGTFDQAGNVWEWTTDSKGNKGVIKGGSFAARETQPRASLKGFAGATEKKGNLGFRCVQDLPTATTAN